MEVQADLTQAHLLATMDPVITGLDLEVTHPATPALGIPATPAPPPTQPTVSPPPPAQSSRVITVKGRQ